jgi:Zn-dependent membrane protease YugP
VTLPVEFDASSRAKRQLTDLGLVASNECRRRQSTLKAPPGRTSRAALAAVAQLLYFLSLLSNR